MYSWFIIPLEFIIIYLIKVVWAAAGFHLLTRVDLFIIIACILMACCITTRIMTACGVL